MGLLKNTIKIILFLVLIVLIQSCSHDLVIKNYFADESGIHMFGKTPQRNFYEDIIISDSLEFLWKSETYGSQSNTSVITYNDYVFVNDLSGRIYGFNIYSGKLCGYYKYSSSISIAPVINKLRIYFIVNLKSENYSLFVMKDITTGKTLNEVKINGSVNNEMIKLKDGIVILTNNGELIKFNFAGMKIWSIETYKSTNSTLASNENIIVFGNKNGELFIVSAKTGEILFSQKVSDCALESLSIDGEHIYFTNNKGGLYSFDLQSNKVIWTFDSKTRIVTVPVYNNENIFIGNLSGKIISINKIEGSVNWILNTGGLINATPLLLRNYLIQPDFNKKIYLIDLIRGKIIKTIEFESRVKLSPVYYKGILFFGIDRGQILAYKTLSEN